MVTLTTTNGFLFRDLGGRTRVVFHGVYLRKMTVTQYLLSGARVPGTTRHRVGHTQGQHNKGNRRVGTQRFLLRLFFLHGTRTLLLVCGGRTRVTRFGVLTSGTIHTSGRVGTTILGPFCGFLLLYNERGS